jgi:hypothetical protein
VSLEGAPAVRNGRLDDAIEVRTSKQQQPPKAKSGPRLRAEPAPKLRIVARLNRLVAIGLALVPPFSALIPAASSLPRTVQ